VRPTRRLLSLAVTAMAIAVTSAVPVRAHHSFAVYEPTLQIKLSGVVTKFKWGNPHVYLEIDAADPRSGEMRHWLLEGASTSILNRAGWKFNMLNAGDRVTVIVSPIRTGEPAALLKQLTLADGRKFSNGAAAGKATIE
jgi:hypothetical protein